MTPSVPVLTLLLHRHGMRNPFLYFEGVGEPLQPEQLALLTPRGNQQMTSLGEYMAKKHGGSKRGNSTNRDSFSAFLASQLITPECLCSSTPRCLDSAMRFYKAFLGKDVTATPLQTNYGAMYFDLIDKNIDGMMAAEFISPHGNTVGDYIDFLNDKANSTYTKPAQRYQVLESYLISYKNGHQLPIGIEPNALFKCLNIMLRQLVVGFELQLSTEILTDILARLRSLSTASTNYVSYSVSDINIVTALEFLGVKIDHWPDFAHAFELSVFADDTVIVNEFENSPDGVITEKPATHKLTVSEIIANIEKALKL